MLNANVATDERDRIALNEDVPGALTGARRIGKYRAFYEIEMDVALELDELAVVIIVSVGHKEHNVLYIRGKVIKL